MCDQINKRGIKHILNGEKIVICEQNNVKKKEKKKRKKLLCLHTIRNHHID